MSNTVNLGSKETAEAWEKALTTLLTTRQTNEVQKLFNEKVAPFNAPSPWKAGQPVGTLDWAIACNASSAIVKGLLAANARPTEGLHALDNLLQKPQLYDDGLVKSLLDANATPTQPDEFLHDAEHPCTLDYALQNRPIEVVKLLVNAKAYATLSSMRNIKMGSKQSSELYNLVNQATQNGRAFQEQARKAEQEKSKRDHLNFKLSMAVSKSDKNEIQRLVAAKAEITGEDLGTLITRFSVNTPEEDRIELVKCLLNAGAKPINGENSTLGRVIGRASAPIIDLLLKADAKPDEETLDSAIIWNRPTEVMRLLLASGAQPKENALRSALACGLAEEGVVRLLLEKGCKIPRASFNVAQRRAQFGKEPYSEETMGLLEGAIAEERVDEVNIELPARQQAQDAQPVQHAQELPAQNSEAQSSHAEQSDALPSGGILARIGRIFGGFCAWLGEIITGILNWFSEEDQD